MMDRIYGIRMDCKHCLRKQAVFSIKNISQFVQIISCNLPVMEITHKNALLTSGPVKKAHLKIRDGVFVPGVSF